MWVLLARHAERADFKDTGSWSQAWYEANALGRPWDPPLTEEGLQQAQELGTTITARLAAVGATRSGRLIAYSSPFLRCYQTALGALHSMALESTVERARSNASADHNTEIQEPALQSLYVDPTLCEHLRADWFDATVSARVDFMLKASKLPAEDHVCVVDAMPTLGTVIYPEQDRELADRAAKIATSLAGMALGHGDEAPESVLLVTHGGVALSIIAALATLCEADTPAMPHQGYGALTTLQLRPRPASPKLDLIVHQLAELPLRLTPAHRWFFGQVPVWESTLMPYIRELKAARDGRMSVLELGSWEGASAAWLVTRCCDESPKSRLTCVDHFDKLLTFASAQRAQKFSYNIRTTALWPRVDVHMKFTVTALTELLMERREWDFVYIDASHDAEDALLDAMLAWKGVRKGGIVVFDDYWWPDFPVDSHYHPKKGIDAFLHVYEHELEVLHRGYQIFVRKTGSTRFNF